jgi:hypothetical protein
MDSLRSEASDIAERSESAKLMDISAGGEEWRSVWLFHTSTLVQRPDGSIRKDGPVMFGIRYHMSFLSEAPDPLSLVTLFMPSRVFNPNVAIGTGVLCLGHPQAGVSLEWIMHLSWAAITLNMRHVTTRWGEILNADAARFVRANAERLPLTAKGIFEEPDPPSLPQPAQAIMWPPPQ